MIESVCPRACTHGRVVVPNQRSPPVSTQYGDGRAPGHTPGRLPLPRRHLHCGRARASHCMVGGRARTQGGERGAMA